MWTKTKIAFAAAIILGTASAALAGDSGENNQGGFVIPGSMDGVNPVYHPGWFGKGRNAGDAFGYAPISSHKHKAR